MAWDLSQLTVADRAVLERGMEGARAVSEPHVRWAPYALAAVVVAPRACPPGALACTGGTAGHRVAAVTRPLVSLGPREAALAVIHESMHWEYVNGIWRQKPHDFVHRPTPAEVARDWIYRDVAWLRANYPASV